MTDKPTQPEPRTPHCSVCGDHFCYDTIKQNAALLATLQAVHVYLSAPYLLPGEKEAIQEMVRAAIAGKEQSE